MENSVIQMVNNGKETIESREVAEMIGKDHAHLMRDIGGYIKSLASQQNPRMDSALFFIPSSYTADDGSRSYPCYLITEMGCVFIANKLNGDKGNLFTAALPWMGETPSHRFVRHGANCTP